MFRRLLVFISYFPLLILINIIRYYYDYFRLDTGIGVVGKKGGNVKLNRIQSC